MTDLTQHRTTTPLFRGGPEGPAAEPVVLVHGLAMSWRAWLPVLPAITARHRVFAPTLPGHRGGPAASGAVSVNALADHLEVQMDEEGLDTAHLVGNSLGGWLSLELARRGRARSVTAISPAGAWRHRGDMTRVNVLLRGTHVAARLGVDPVLTRPALRVPRVRRTVFHRVMERGDLVPVDEAVGLLLDARECRVLPQLVRSGRRQGMVEPLDDVDVRVQVLWGQRDRVIPWARHGRPLRDRLTRADFVPLEGLGHTPMYDDPALVAERILRVIRIVVHQDPIPNLEGGQP